MEPLWIGRINDILANKPQLRDADLTNSATSNARYNDLEVSKILVDLVAIRKQLVGSLESLNASDFEKASDHPRLKIPMRAVDLAFFVAEHDDYHLARISYLIRYFRST